MLSLSSLLARVVPAGATVDLLKIDCEGDELRVLAGVAADDWPRIAQLYEVLHTLNPSPVVALNRAAAIGLAYGPQAGLDAMAGLDEVLSGYSHLASARADLCRRAGRIDEAIAYYEQAMAQTSSETEKAFYASRLTQLESPEA